jgi:hypothetical protein
MAKYFNFFPKTAYYKSKDSTSLDVVTNITTRYNFNDTLKQNAATYYKYEIKDGDTPEILASKIYGSPEKHWIILAMNNIVDPLYEWPLGQRTIGKFIEAKYSSSSYANTAYTGVTGLEWATNNTQAYYKVEKRTDTSTGLYREDRIRLDANTYANVVISDTNYTLEDGTPLRIVVSKETKTYYEYENELNENKRNITILKPEFVIDIEAEFINVMKDSV